MIAPHVIVDPEFAALIPPLTRDEDLALTESIRREGCRDALIVWRSPEGDTLLDGHNRLRICEEDRIDYRITVAPRIFTRDQAYTWIISNQLARRNITPDQASYLRGKRYEREKGREGRPDKLYQNDTVSPGTTRERLASELGVSAPTIARDAGYAHAVDTIVENVGPEAKEAILSGDAPLTKVDVLAVAAAEPEEQREVFAALTPVEMGAAARALRKRQEAPSTSIARAFSVVPQPDEDDTQQEASDAPEQETTRDQRMRTQQVLLEKRLGEVYHLYQLTPEQAVALILHGHHQPADRADLAKDKADKLIEWLRQYSTLLSKHVTELRKPRIVGNE